MADEVRLIDANELKYIESNTNAYSEEWNADYEKGFRDCWNKVMALPTVEAEPVKHGRWIDNGVVYTCSECNSSVPKNIFVIGCDFEGCPYCFARMDGESE